MTVLKGEVHPVIRHWKICLHCLASRMDCISWQNCFASFQSQFQFQFQLSPAPHLGPTSFPWLPEQPSISVFFCMPTWAPLLDFQVPSDATGSMGYGAIFQSYWFSSTWSVVQSSLSIAYKELFPILVAAYLWGPQWVSRRVKFLCDNESVVAVLKSDTSRDKSRMVLLRHLAMLAIHDSFCY